MPRVPPSGFPAVQADTRLGSFRFAGPSPELAAAPGRQFEAYGGALQRAGAALTGIATDMQQEANRVRVTAAQNLARGRANHLKYGGGEDGDPGYLSYVGETAVNRPDGVALPAAYTSKLREGLSEIQESLGNDVQKAAFIEWRKSFEVDFIGDVTRYMLMPAEF